MSNLVERLENCSRYNSAVDPREMCLEAASAISRLTEEVERLRGKNARLAGDCHSYAKTMDAISIADAEDRKRIAEATARAEAAEARVKELEEAIAPFAKAGELFPPRDPETFDACVYAPAKGRKWSICGDDLRRARAALTSDPK